MYCVIQKVKNKKTDPYGEHKKLLTSKTTFTYDGVTKTSYGYTYSQERFERPITDAYKISIHESYRHKGKVKKKQWAIYTMSYYSIIEYSLYDCADSRITKKAAEIGISTDELYDMILQKLDPLYKQLKMKFETSEKYKTKIKHQEILSQYRAAKNKFEEEYGSGEYDYCYDIFGTLQNKEYLHKLKEHKIATDEYTKRSYQNSYQSNYSDYFKSSYSITNQSTYSENEKKMLKKIYRVASKKFHPDITNDDGRMMKFLTRLKEQ